MCWAALLPALAISGTANAADHGWYLGAAYSNVSPDYAPPPSIIVLPAGGVSGVFSSGIHTPSYLTGDELDSIGSTGFKAVAGYRAFDWLAFEVDYLDLSSDSVSLGLVCVTQPCPNTFHADTSSASLSALALWPLGKFDLFARIGLSRWKTELEAINTDGSRFWSQDLLGTDEKYGAGAQIHFDKVTARLEYEHLRFSGDAADTWSIGAAYSFR
jgi:opacity protein-like surface antigen